MSAYHWERRVTRGNFPAVVITRPFALCSTNTAPTSGIPLTRRLPCAAPITKSAVDNASAVEPWGAITVTLMQGRFDRTAQTWIEDVAVAAAVALERSFALARGADGASCDPEAEERVVAIARIGDDDRPSTIDATHVPEAARAEIDLRARHTARAEHRQRAIDRVSLANAAEIQRGAVGERDRLRRSRRDGHAVASDVRCGLAADRRRRQARRLRVEPPRLQQRRDARIEGAAGRRAQRCRFFCDVREIDADWLRPTSGARVQPGDFTLGIPAAQDVFETCDLSKRRLDDVRVGIRVEDDQITPRPHDVAHGVKAAA